MPRFLPTVQSRILLTKWDPTVPQTEPIISFLDRHAHERRASFSLGNPATFRGRVPADDPEINILYDDNFGFTGSGFFDQVDYPNLTEGVRLLTWLRRENPPSGIGPWVARFRGPILQTEDSADEDFGVTDFVAYDPWAMLFKRPCLRCVLDTTSPASQPVCSMSGGLPVVDPTPRGEVIFPAGTELQYIAGELLRRTISAHGPVMIDAGDGSSASGDGNDYGGTATWGGTIETCATTTVDWRIQDGTTLGELWQQLQETGLLKIILVPVYDDTRPGVCAELNIFRTDSAYDGLYERQAAMSLTTGFPALYWDGSGHDMIEISRLSDGTERINKLQFLGPNGYRAGIITSDQSVTRMGQYWGMEQFNRLTREDQINVQAQKRINLVEQGRRTWQIAPTPEFTYRPFQDYDLGWWLTMYHSDRLREDIYSLSYGSFQVLGFDVDISDEGTEAVSGMLLSIDDTWDPDAP